MELPLLINELVLLYRLYREGMLNDLELQYEMIKLGVVKFEVVHEDVIKVIVTMIDNTTQIYKFTEKT